jgi:peptidoglycan hydrolase-like protein with peptidoglycan-binding domain
VRRLLSGIFIAIAVAGAGVAVALAVTSDDPSSSSARSPIERTTSTTSTTTSTTTTTTTTEPPTTTTAPPTTTTTTEPPPVVEEEVADPDVTALQTRLSELGYWLGEPDGNYGHLTRQAVMAFQKANGLSRDGEAGPVTMEALAVATGPPAAQVTPGDGLEIDIERQIILVVDDGVTRFVLNTSTGRSGWTTWTGDYVVERTIDGWRHAPLGDLYRPAYFHGGQAVHGAASIPGHPASHGCARVSIPAMDMLWADGFAVRGVPVTVY